MTNYIVENKDMLPFKGMSDEDKLKIVNAIIADPPLVEVLCCDDLWREGQGRTVSVGGTYRIKAKATPLNIPWQHIHPQWEWAAMDKDGSVWAYSDKPLLTQGSWSYIDDCVWLSRVMCINTDNINWKISLTERPEGGVTW